MLGELGAVLQHHKNTTVVLSDCGKSHKSLDRPCLLFFSRLSVYGNRSAWGRERSEIKGVSLIVNVGVKPAVAAWKCLCALKRVYVYRYANYLSGREGVCKSICVINVNVYNLQTI